MRSIDGIPWRPRAPAAKRRRAGARRPVGPGRPCLFDPFTPAALREAAHTTYAARPRFNDTLKTVRDRDSLAEYLAGTAGAVRHCSVTVDEWSPAAAGWYARWRMTIRFERLRPDTDTHSIGISHLVFDRDARIAVHQDFRDAAGGFYEHLPVLGGLVRRMRQRL